METKQQLIAVKVERLQELQVDLDRIHQEQATLLNELVQLTSAVAAYTLSPQRKSVRVFKSIPTLDAQRRTQHRRTRYTQQYHP